MVPQAARDTLEVSEDSVFVKRSFLKLPVAVDLGRLLDEYRRIPEEAWGVSHWDVHCSIDSLLLRGGSKGTADDFVTADVSNNPLLEKFPYLSSLLDPEGPFGGSRYAFVFRTKPSGITRIHWDNESAWHRTFRVHIPIITNADAVLLVESKAKHFPAGEAWTFDNQALHSVVNGHATRVHLIIDVEPNPKLRSLLERATFDPGRDDPQRWQLTGGPHHGGRLPPLVCETAEPLTIRDKKELGLDPLGFASRVSAQSRKAKLLRSPLRVGDIIVGVNGVQSCELARSALDYVRLRHEPGERIELRLLRGGTELCAAMRLRPADYFDVPKRLVRLLGLRRPVRALLQTLRGGSHG